MQKLPWMSAVAIVVLSIVSGGVAVQIAMPTQMDAYWGGILANAVSALAFSAVGLALGDRIIAMLEEAARLRRWKAVTPFVNQHLDASFIHIYGNLNVRLGLAHRYVASNASLPKGLRA